MTLPLAAVALAAPLACAADDDGPMNYETGQPDVCAAAGHPNVVLIALESFRHSAVTPYAPDLPTTPFLAQLALEGTLVEAAYAVVPHTTKALVPLLCGNYPKIAKETVETAPGGLPWGCLAARLGGAGFASLFIQPARPTFEGRTELVRNIGYGAFESSATLPTAGFDESSYFGFEDDVMLAPTLDWIDAQECPFFVTVLTLASHHDYQVPAGFPTQPFALGGPYNDYLNTVAYTDRFVSELYQGLADRGLVDDTVVIAVGDHGEGFGEHDRFQHDNVIWEEGLRVPMILAGPGIEAGRVIEGPFQLLDVPPTIERLLDVELGPSDYVGRDILADEAHPRLFFSCWADDRCMAMREGARKVIYHYDALPTAVHDLLADPSEYYNAIADGDNPAFAAAAVEAMLAWKSATNAAYGGPRRR